MKFEFGNYKFDFQAAFPNEVPNNVVANAVWSAHQALRTMSEVGLFHLLTGANNSVSHSDPEVRTALQSNVNEAAEMFVLLYCFSIWDHFVDRLPSVDKKSLWVEWMTADEKLQFFAYRHVRHSVAHCFDGRRAGSYRKEFDTVMSGPNPLGGVVWSQTTDVIDLSPGGAGLQCFTFLQGLTQSLTGRLVNRNMPTISASGSPKMQTMAYLVGS